MLTPQSKFFSTKFKVKGFQLYSPVTVDSAKIDISFTIKKQNLSSSTGKYHPRKINTDLNSIELCNLVPLNNTQSQITKHCNSDIMINIGSKQSHTYTYTYSEILSKKYKCFHLKEEKKIKLFLHLTDQIYLNFHLVEKPRFAKTNKLQMIISGQDENQEGMITMDQAGRILLEDANSQFPSIGLWLRFSDIYDGKVFLKVFSFLRRKPSKHFSKLMTTFQNNNYIQLVKVEKNKLPELYLVSWKTYKIQNGQKQFVFEEQENIKVRFLDQLQFTLRGNHSIQNSSLVNDQIKYSSPRKQTSDELENQLNKIHLQQSPQFSSIKKSDPPFWVEEKSQLQRRVQEQGKIIEQLKKQVERLKKELKKNQSHPQPQRNAILCKSPDFLTSSPTDSLPISAQKLKKLSSSDLENSSLKIFQSGSTKEKNSVQDTRNSELMQYFNEEASLNKKYMDFTGEEEDPWDMIQLIQ